MKLDNLTDEQKERVMKNLKNDYDFNLTSLNIIKEQVDKIFYEVQRSIRDNNCSMQYFQDQADSYLKKIKEKTISRKQKDFLRVINSIRTEENKFKYIVRNSNGTVILLVTKPFRDLEDGIWHTDLVNFDNYFTIADNSYFPFVSWEDKEPFLVEDALNLPIDLEDEE